MSPASPRPLITVVRERAAAYELQESPLRHAAPDRRNLLELIGKIEAEHAPYFIADECADESCDLEHMSGNGGEYRFCMRTVTGVACEACCSDGEAQTEECASSHSHDMNDERRCETIKIIYGDELLPAAVPAPAFIDVPLPLENA